MDCGPTCLRIIAKYYGREIAPPPTNIGVRGVSMLDLHEAAISIGFQSHAVKLSWEELEQRATLPLIAHWRQIHFVVVYRISPQKVYVADPGIGLATYTKEDFVERWADTTESGAHYGFALLLKP